MNINQQSEIEELFKRISKTQAKNNKTKVSDDDINKVRAFVVQSQRPLQAVRLLQKEREEREVDDKFTTQKEEIIQKAKQLDQEAKHFYQKKQQMSAIVESDVVVMVKNQLKRKSEDKKLADAKLLVQKYEREIKELKDSIATKQGELETRQRQLNSHKKFSLFLSQVVADKQLSEIIAASKTTESGKSD